jgi:catechol 2,3-dioxygenase-like lactoylglutathione lyase family enzyme
MNVAMVATVAVISAEPAQSRRLFMDTLGLPLEGEGDGYYSTGRIPGCNHFGIWPLAEAAQSCFGRPEWPEGLVVPQASIEFEVESPEAVEAAATELQRAGYDVLHPARTEPWGQIVARLLTKDGMILGMSYIPAFHQGAGSPEL